MKKPLWVLVGGVLALLGLLFTLQGTDVISGSAMSGTAFWAVAGPIIIVIGLLVATVGARGRTRWCQAWPRYELGCGSRWPGKAIQNSLAKVSAPMELHDPTALVPQIPVGDAFRYYTVTGECSE
jgi:hypothetical protein